MQSSKILVTGTAGFIGFHLARRLARDFPTAQITGLDNVNSYYDPRLKEDRLKILSELPNFAFHRLDLADRAGMADLFQTTQPGLCSNSPRPCTKASP
jgi:UDP-glucuronate 4-epimerase